MADVELTAALRREYEALFATCRVRPERWAEVDHVVDGLLGGRERYRAAGDEVGVPWPVVAVLHSLEASLDFERHLHNGDPLSGRTVHEPAGRPVGGSPPFSWHASAVDALRASGLSRGRDWGLAATLYRLERTNGWGYRLHHPEVLSPYLWSFSEHYDLGKYVADGRWSGTAVSRQPGAAVLLRRLAERGEVAFDEIPVGPLIPYSADGVVPRADELQAFLNTFPGIRLRVDGWPGPRTSAAFRVVFGRYLHGDPRDEV
jgi:lysozyme family protein